MKHFITLLILFATTCVTFAQSKISIEYKSDFTVTLNGQSVDNTTTYNDIVKLLGEPSIYREYPSGKTNYHYKDLGLVIHTVNGNLLTIGTNYNWDGDKNFPETTFEGEFIIGGKSVSKDTKGTIVEELKDLKINCIIPGLCMNDPKKIKNPILLGFKDDAITQVSIEFH